MPIRRKLCRIRKKFDIVCLYIARARLKRFENTVLYCLSLGGGRGIGREAGGFSDYHPVNHGIADPGWTLLGPDHQRNLVHREKQNPNLIKKIWIRII